MESTHITKAVAYCRVSSQKQVTEGNGLESQRARIEEYAKIRGYDLVEIFKDDITGATAGRPAMKAMLSGPPARPMAQAAGTLPVAPRLKAMKASWRPILNCR